MAQVHYVMQGQEIIFSGTAADCKRISAKVPDSRIEPPVDKKQAVKGGGTTWDF